MYLKRAGSFIVTTQNIPYRDKCVVCVSIFRVISILMEDKTVFFLMLNTYL